MFRDIQYPVLNSRSVFVCKYKGRMGGGNIPIRFRMRVSCIEYFYGDCIKKTEMGEIYYVMHMEERRNVIKLSSRR